MCNVTEAMQTNFLVLDGLECNFLFSENDVLRQTVSHFPYIRDQKCTFLLKNPNRKVDR